MKQSRRRFLFTSATAFAAVSCGFGGLQKAAETAGGSKLALGMGYGPLLDDPQGILNLPKGFSYKVISRQGETMDDGLLVPGKADGMATFAAGAGKTLVVRNHEMSPGYVKESPFGNDNGLFANIDKASLYDAGADGNGPSLGGTTTFLYDHQTQKVERQYLSLAGTNRNCAGGQTPWNSWISCEENVDRAGDGQSAVDHGYCFEVPATENIGIVPPAPIKDMGRFNHEAVCVDPKTGIVYLTEDRHEGLIYRYLPNQKGQLHQGGQLQALVIKGRKSFDTRNWESQDLAVGEKLQAEWIDLDGVEAPDDDLRFRGFEAGAARFARGEGMWFGEGEFYFACTNGGNKRQGQLYRYTPAENEGQPGANGTLELFIEPNDSDIVRNCDNVTVAPWGDVIMCEDNESPRIIGVTPKGEIYHFAHNVGHDSEFAGATFSPDGSTLFVNIQHAGLTLAIYGDWKTA